METQSTLLSHGNEAQRQDTNPYLAARREWDDRYGALASSRRHWQLASASTALCSLILAIGFVLLSLQHTVLPYVIHVDEHGHALIAGPIPAENGTSLTDERILPYHLAGFIRHARSVITDRIAMKKHLDHVYAHARRATQGFLDEYYRAHNSFETAKQQKISVHIHTLLPYFAPCVIHSLPLISTSTACSNRLC